MLKLGAARRLCHVCASRDWDNRGLSVVGEVVGFIGIVFVKLVIVIFGFFQKCFAFVVFSEDIVFTAT